MQTSQPFSGERLEHLRELAAEAKRSAASAKTPEQRKAFLELVRAWEDLLAEIDGPGRDAKVSRGAGGSASAP